MFFEAAVKVHKDPSTGTDKISYNIFEGFPKFRVQHFAPEAAGRTNVAVRDAAATTSGKQRGR